MRLKYLVLTAAVLMPASAGAQDANTSGRLDRLEQEVRALQRQVFPGGSGRFFEPEIEAQQQPRTVPGISNDTTTVANLMTRVDALESQLANLTGQVEERGYQMRQMEMQLSAMQNRLAMLEAAPPTAAPSVGDEAPFTTTTPAGQSPETTEAPSAVSTVARQQAVAAVERPATGNAAEDSYIYGYRLWEARFYPEAQAQLAKMVKDYPSSSRASHARNLLGRTWLDDGKPATSAQHFLENYQKDPRGERAPDSLYFLGVALTRLDKDSEACQAFAELADVYPDIAAGRLAERVSSGRENANCS